MEISLDEAVELIKNKIEAQEKKFIKVFDADPDMQGDFRGRHKVIHIFIEIDTCFVPVNGHALFDLYHLAEDVIAVSYTHLDVYKRQEPELEEIVLDDIPDILGGTLLEQRLLLRYDFVFFLQLGKIPFYIMNFHSLRSPQKPFLYQSLLHGL